MQKVIYQQYSTANFSNHFHIIHYFKTVNVSFY